MADMICCEQAIDDDTNCSAAILRYIEDLYDFICIYTYTHMQYCANVLGHHSICCFSKVVMTIHIYFCVFIKIQPENTGNVYNI